MVKLFKFRELDQPFGKRRRASPMLKLLVPKLKADGGPLQVRDPKSGKWTTTDIESLARNIRVGPLGERVAIRTPRRRFEVYSLHRPWLYLGQLPEQAKVHNWSRVMREQFRYFMWHGFSWLGTYNKRRARHDPNVWSVHSWPGAAHDFGSDGRTAKMDKAVANARRRWGKQVNYVWESLNHRGGVPEHVHAEKIPKPTGTPP